MFSFSVKLGNKYTTENASETEFMLLILLYFSYGWFIHRAFKKFQTDNKTLRNKKLVLGK